MQSSYSIIDKQFNLDPGTIGEINERWKAVSTDPKNINLYSEVMDDKLIRWSSDITKLCRNHGQGVLSS